MRVFTKLEHLMVCVSYALVPVLKVLFLGLAWAGIWVCYRELLLALSVRYQRASVVGSVASAVLNRLSQGRWRIPGLLFGLFGTAIVDWCAARVAGLFAQSDDSSVVVPDASIAWLSDSPSADGIWPSAESKVFGSIACCFLGLLFKRRLW